MTATDLAAVDNPLGAGERVLDRYVVVERFETGGTSIVYRGEDERLSRPVCIKVFNTIRDKEWLYRTTYEHFVQEAFALSRLSHPNTLRIYDFGHMTDPRGGGEGLPFQVSEYMNGGTLSNLVRREGPLAPSEAHRVVAAISGALDEAHHSDIIHRDIKPKNILFGTTGQSRQAKLADFGIAKSLAIDAAALRNRAGDTQVVAGRRLLMFSGLWASPEQLTAQPASAASDIYSWALVTIFMLTGQSVFSTNDPADAYRQRKESDALIDQALRGGGFPPAVTELFKRTCGFDPSVRPPSAGAFAEALVAAFERKAPRGLALPSPADDAAPTEARRRATSSPPPPPPGRGRPTTGSGAIITEAPSSVSGAAEVAVPSPGAPVPALTALPTLAGAAPEARAPHRLSPSLEPQRIGDRTARFVPLDSGAAELSAARGQARFRVTLVPASSNGFAFHVRGLNCFVKKGAGRPSGATQLEASGPVEFVAPNQKPLGRAEVLFGSPAAGHHVFSIGDEVVALGTAEVPLAVALDFGPGDECLFVYVGRAAAPEERGGRGRRRDR